MVSFAGILAEATVIFTAINRGKKLLIAQIYPGAKFLILCLPGDLES